MSHGGPLLLVGKDRSLDSDWLIVNQVAESPGWDRIGLEVHSNDS